MIFPAIHEPVDILYNRILVVLALLRRSGKTAMRKEAIPGKTIIIVIAMLLALAAFGCTGNESAEPVSEKQEAPEEPGLSVSPTELTGSEAQENSNATEEEVEEDEEAPASATGSIEGMIYLDDDPIELATIQVENSGHRIVTRIRADVVGRYSVGDLSPGMYTLRYIKSSGAAYGIGRQVRVRAGETTEYDIRLTSRE
jgi:hypothetical protein